MTKANNELKAKNKELTDDLKAMEQQRIQSQKQTKPVVTSQPKNIKDARYSFTKEEPSRTYEKEERTEIVEETEEYSDKQSEENVGDGL